MKKYRTQFKEMRKNYNHDKIEYILGYLKELIPEVRKLKKKYTEIIENTPYGDTNKIYNTTEKLGKFSRKPLADLWDLVAKMSKNLDKFQ